MKPIILCVDDEADITRAVELYLLKEDVEIDTFNDPNEGLEAAKNKEYDLALVDIRMPGMTGIEFMTKLTELSPRTVKINMSSHADLNVVLEALGKNHVYDFIKKPLKREKLLGSVRKALDFFRLKVERDQLSLSLKEKNEELESWNNRLDAEVKKKTKELSIRDHLMQHLAGCPAGGHEVYSLIQEYFGCFTPQAKVAIYLLEEGRYCFNHAYGELEEGWLSELAATSGNLQFRESDELKLSIQKLERQGREVGVIVMAQTKEFSGKDLGFIESFVPLVSLVVYDELVSGKVSELSLNLLKDD